MLGVRASSGMDVAHQGQEFIAVSMTSPVRVNFGIVAWIMLMTDLWNKLL